MNLRHGSLFSGYGGLDIAIEEVFGARTAWVSDVDKGACKVLAHRYPGVPNLGDITAVDWSTVEPVDLISGGSPCQDLSHAGKRGGMTEGTRSNLWVAMREAIAQLRPTYVIWENVRGAYSAAADSDVEPCPGCVGDGPGVHLRALGRVLGDLSDLGYMGGWHGLRAADVGAPHGRFRVFVVARLAAADTLGERRGERRLAAPGQAPGGRASAVDRGRGGAPVALLPTPVTTDAKGHSAGDLRRHSPGLRTLSALLPTPRATDGTKGGPNQRGSSDVEGGRKHRSGARSDELLLNGIAAADRWGQYADAIARWEHVSGRPAPEPTEPTGRGGAPRLSPAFTEWLMGLPAGWITDVPGITRNEALKLCGNGVVPQQAITALREITSWTEAAA